MDGVENHNLQESSDSSDVCSDDMFSSGSDIFAEEKDDEEEENSSPCDDDEPLRDMSTLLQELPLKKGLSKHYSGKSQSFTSLSNVRSLEDLAKPENPFNKKLRACRRSYGGVFLEACKRNRHCSSSSSSAKFVGILKKSAGRSGGGGLCSRKNGSFFIGNKPSSSSPTHASPSSSNFANPTPLLA